MLALVRPLVVSGTTKVVLLSLDGYVKILDFGIARATFASALERRRLRGKPRYMAPEQTLGDPPTAEVTGQVPGAEITSQALSSLAILYAILTALIGFVARMPWGFSWAAGLMDALLIAWLGHFFLLVPTLRARAHGEQPAPRESESDASRAA